MKWVQAAIGAVVLFLANGAGALADVTLTRLVKTGSVFGLGSIEVRQVEQLHGSRAREESHPRGNGQLQRVFDPLDDAILLISLDTNVIQKIDLGNQVYEEIPLKDWIDYLASRPQYAAMANANRLTDLKSDFHTRPTRDTKRINGFSCQKYIYEVSMQVENPEQQTRVDLHLVNVIWADATSASLKRARQEEDNFRQSYLAKMGAPLTPEDLRKFGAKQVSQLTGLDEKKLEETLAKEESALSQIKGYPVVVRSDWYMRLYKEGKEVKAGALLTPGKPFLSVVTELQSVAFQPLPAGRFRPPRDYNKIPTYSIPSGSDGS